MSASFQRYTNVIRDAEGTAVADATVDIYVGDSNTRATLYDGAGNTVTNPATTDSDGVIINDTLSADPLDKVGFRAPAGRYRIEGSKGVLTLGPLPDILIGNASAKDTGTAAGDLVKLEDVGGSAGLPAVDGSQLTGDGPDLDSPPLVNSQSFPLAVVDFSANNGRKRNLSNQVGSLTWTEHRDSPVISQGGVGTWNEGKGDTGGTLMFFDGRWWYWHSGRDGGGADTIGLHIAGGSQITSWGSAAESPVLGLGGANTWDESGVSHPSVILWDGLLRMWYGGTNAAGGQQIGLATSPDGVTWTKAASNPVLSPGGAGAWDEGGVGHPGVIWDGTQLVMAYRGWAAGDADTQSQIGIATSTDGGETWTKIAANPVLTYGGAGAWDEWGLLAPRLWIERGKYFMNYSGKYNDVDKYSSIGHASAPDLSTWTKDVNNPLLDENDVTYIEVEWGNLIQINGIWHLFAPAFFDGGVTTVWIGL